jgi:transposase-like protein
MLHIYLQLFGVDGLLGIIATHPVTMKDKHFALAVSGIKINKHNREAVSRVLVGGEGISEVAREIGMSQSQLSKQVRRVLQNLYKVLDARGLMVEEWIVDQEMKPVIDALEQKSIDAAPAFVKKRRKGRTSDN